MKPNLDKFYIVCKKCGSHAVEVKKIIDTTGMDYDKTKFKCEICKSEETL